MEIMRPSISTSWGVMSVKWDNGFGKAVLKEHDTWELRKCVYWDRTDPLDGQTYQQGLSQQHMFFWIALGFCQATWL